MPSASYRPPQPFPALSPGPLKLPLTSVQASHLQALQVGSVIGGAVGESCNPGHIEELMTFPSLGTADIQHTLADGAGAMVDELRDKSTVSVRRKGMPLLHRVPGHHSPRPAAGLLPQD